MSEAVVAFCLALFIILVQTAFFAFEYGFAAACGTLGCAFLGWSARAYANEFK